MCNEKEMKYFIVLETSRARNSNVADLITMKMYPID